MEDTPAPRRRSGERGVQDGYDANVVYHPAIPIKRLGILSYRQQRSHTEFLRTIKDALTREARLREQAGAPDPWLRDTAAWIGRGALPE